MNQIYIEKLYSEGYLHLKNFLKKEDIESILTDSKKIFFNQFIEKGLNVEETILNHESEFNNALFSLFELDLEVYMNCAKQIQHLISLHRLSLSENIIDLLKQLNFKFPNISTRPVLFINHPKLAKEKIYYKVDAHQDWRSMQGSLNSVVVWVPLVDINKNLGALEIVPSSHKLGLITKKVDHGFGMVDLDESLRNQLTSIEVNVGDILLFSSFLIHQSGENISENPRWSCHFRYNDLMESTFINRGYPHSYIYKPIEHLITPDFPSIEAIKNSFDIES